MPSLENQKCLKEVTKKFLLSGKSVSKTQELQTQEKWFRGTKYKIYNIKRDSLKKLLKTEFSFSSFNNSQKAKVWSYIFKNTEYLDIGSLAIDYFKQFQNKKSHPLEQYWPLLKTWGPKIENWVHGDMLCGLYCDTLSENSKKVYPTLKTWSESKSPWKNRIAMISLLYYYNPKRNLLPYNKIISLVEPHLEKDHYYLQKAVGWTLRESLRAHERQTWKFINKNVLKISSTAFSTVVENLSAKERLPLKEKRKLHRKKK